MQVYKKKDKKMQGEGQRTYLSYRKGRWKLETDGESDKESFV